MVTKAEQSDTTRRALVAAARSLFAEHGFADTPTEAVVQTAGVTRGALYHHFRDKAALFQAVYEELEQELVAKVEAGVDGLRDPLTVLRRGSEAFLDACLDPAFMRVVLLEGPTVLGWEKWREIDQSYGLGMVKATLEMASAAGSIRRGLSVEPLAHVLLGGLMEGSLYLANAEDKDAGREQVGKAIGALIDGLAAKPKPAGATKKRPAGGPARRR
ncbi:MAG TPA: TetR/AcrR family transcriptional regulator [Acidimicrobiales bacterium]|jgi:AcrR family transcriptional regulator|nr:TetR/AcrR family transcriptional regulator [Acidimicrobiales bacterium]